jgi:hypothetical protein
VVSFAYATAGTHADAQHREDDDRRLADLHRLASNRATVHRAAKVIHHHFDQLLYRFHGDLLVTEWLDREVGAVHEDTTPGDVREFVCLTVSADHQIVDGAPLARFVRELRQLLEAGAGLAEAIGG